MTLYAFVAASTFVPGTISATSVSPVLPAAAQAGDFCFYGIGREATATATYTMASGFLPTADIDQAFVGNQMYGHVAGKILDAADIAAGTLVTSWTGSNVRCFACLAVYRGLHAFAANAKGDVGVAASGQVAVTKVAEANVVGATPLLIPSFWIARCSGASDGTGTFTPDAALNSRLAVPVINGTNDYLFGITDEQWQSAAAFPSRTSTMHANPGVGNLNGVMLELAPTIDQGLATPAPGFGFGVAPYAT